MQRLPKTRWGHWPLCAAQLLMAWGMAPGVCAGQAADSAAAQARPAAAVFENPIASDQLVFLKDFEGRPAKELTKDKRFRALMKAVIPRTEFHYGGDMPLDDAWEEVVFGSKEPVAVRAGRYVLVWGHEGPYLRGRGFLWFDMQDGIALGGFYFRPVNGEPTPTLAIFSRQLKATALGMSQLPLEFARDESEWVRTAELRVVSPRYFIPENGKKYVLVHDEDYCDHPENAPAPPEDVCEALNLEAADADLDAATFITEAHNAANATAWRTGGLLPVQGAYVGFSESSCRNAANPARCRIRAMRQRTQAVLGQR
jgi:hypothetical protein